MSSDFLLLWSRLGPYHVARIRGLDKAIREKHDGAFEVVGLQVAKVDHYRWKSIDDYGGAAIVTVMPDTDYWSLSFFRIFIAVFRMLKKLDPNVVAVNGWSVPEAISGIAWCTLRRVPCVLMSETKRDDGEGRRRTVKEWIKRLVVARCDAAVVGGTKQAEYLQELGFKAERIFIGYDVVDNEYFERAADRVRIGTRGPNESRALPEKYFFACTRFVKRKNVDGLLRAYDLYRESCGKASWGLVIAGSGEEEERLKSFARRRGMNDVIWTGFLQYEELPLYYGLASAFIHAAKQEPWGLVVNEAAASGLPLIVGNTVGSGYELVREDENGWLVDAYDDEDICRRMVDMTTASDLDRKEMGAASRKVVSEWSPKRFGDAMIAAHDASMSPTFITPGETSQR